MRLLGNDTPDDDKALDDKGGYITRQRWLQKALKLVFHQTTSHTFYKLRQRGRTPRPLYTFERSHRFVVACSEFPSQPKSRYQYLAIDWGFNI